MFSLDFSEGLKAAGSKSVYPCIGSEFQVRGREHVHLLISFDEISKNLGGIFTYWKFQESILCVCVVAPTHTDFFRSLGSHASYIGDSELKCQHSMLLPMKTYTFTYVYGVCMHVLFVPP